MAGIIEYSSAAEPEQLYAPIRSEDLQARPEPNGRSPLDRAPADPGMMSHKRLEAFLDDLRLEPLWRRDSDRAADYYDGNQLDGSTLQALKDKGLGPLIRNLTAPTIDAVLGLEERSRLDWRVVSDFDDQMEIAEALSAKLHEAERETGADRAMSDAYKGAVVSGFSAVEVSRQTNPFLYPYRVQHVHRRELYWDWRSRAVDWSDARFVLRKRWYDADLVAAHFPQHARIIQSAALGDSGWTDIAIWSSESVTGYMRDLALEVERTTTIDSAEWRDTDRKRVCVFEVHYRTFHRGIILKLPRGRIVEYDPKNQMHVALVASGQVKPVEAVYDKFRCAYFVGPHRLADFATGRRRFPYIPWWGKREDLTGVPYGLVRSMMSVQDEINTRLAKMMWYLTSRRTIVDHDAVDGVAGEQYNDMAQLSAEVGRADAFIVLNADRRNQAALQVDANMQLADSQHRAMLDALQAMPQVSGVYAPMLGQQTGTTANSAIQTLLDQGVTTLAEINANHLYGRRMVGEALLELVKEDLIEPTQVNVDTGARKKQIFLNRKVQDPETGLASVQNNVAASAVKVSLDDTPQTPTFRAKQFAQISEVLKSTSPEAQAILMPFLIEASDLSMRKEVSKLLREKLGVGLDPNSPEGQQAMQAQQAGMELQQRAANAEIATKEAQAQKYLAEAEEKRAQIQKMADPNHPEYRNEAARIELERAKLQAEERGLAVQKEIETLKASQNADSPKRMAQLAGELDERLKEIEAWLTEKFDKIKEDLDERESAAAKS